MNSEKGQAMMVMSFSSASSSISSLGFLFLTMMATSNPAMSQVLIVCTLHNPVISIGVSFSVSTSLIRSEANAFVTSSSSRPSPTHTSASSSFTISLSVIFSVFFIVY